tara:strand:- start:52 stop:516 length:465 start_codon:yes stop_codon:yes gene_type:complete
MSYGKFAGGFSENAKFSGFLRQVPVKIVAPNFGNALRIASGSTFMIGAGSIGMCKPPQRAVARPGQAWGMKRPIAVAYAFDISKVASLYPRRGSSLNSILHGSRIIELSSTASRNWPLAIFILILLSADNRLHLSNFSALVSVLNPMIESPWPI